MARDPTFMFCVGATKSGTSWLHDHLSRHDECYFRTIKELHYFGLADPVQFATALQAGRHEIARLSGLLPNVGDKAGLIARRLSDLRDWQKVLRARERNLLAYKAFLTQGMGNAAVVGEVTPAYALLPLDRLVSMVEVGTDVRVVYLVRDPVARLWSHVRMIAKNAGPARFAHEAGALLERIIFGQPTKETNGILARGDYALVVPKLVKAFDPKRLLILFYEELISVAGISKLSAFLGITAGQADVNRKVHQGLPLALPIESRSKALAFLQPQYEFMARHMGHLPQAWQHGMIEGTT